MNEFTCAGLTGLGLLLCWNAATTAPNPDGGRHITDTPLYRRLCEDLRLAGFPQRTVAQLLVVCGLCAIAGTALGLAFTRVLVLGCGIGGVCGYLPILIMHTRAQTHLRRRRDAWPDAVDHVASAVRAGLSIPEALRQLAEHGPEVLRDDFAAFARHDAAHGHFDLSLDVLKETLADPSADRLIESLRLARNVGGSDVGRLLRTLSAFLREDAATRADLAARQSWSISAARLALAAPWLAILIVGFRGGDLRAYGTQVGTLVLGGGAVVSLLAYAMMRAIGRLPTEERIMR